MSVYVRAVVEALAERGQPSHVYTRMEDPASPPTVELAGGSRLIHIPIGRGSDQACTNPAGVDKSGVFYHLPDFLRGVIDHARTEGIEYRAIHSHYWLSGWVGERLSQRWGVPWLHMAHTLGRVKDRDRPPGAAFEPAQRIAVEDEIARACNRLVAPTAQEVEDLAILYGAGRECAAVVAPGVDLARFHPVDTAGLRHELGLAERDRVVLFTGRLERLKGVETLIRAIDEIRRRDPELPVRLLVLGSDSSNGAREAGNRGGERGRLEGLCRRLGVADRVDFLGRVGHDRLPAYYSLADLTCVPSYNESFGFVAIESLACGTPVVASRVGGLRQLVLDGISGYSIPDHDPARYADAICRLLRDDSLRAVMGAAGRRVARAYSWDATAERLLALYDEVEADYSRAAAEVLRPA
jgi:D-inositol-3-phosphate glycosyltransferase